MKKSLEYLRGIDRVAGWVLWINLIGMTLYILVGTRQFYAGMTGTNPHGLAAVGFHWAASWVFLLLPVLIAWKATGNRLLDAGLGLGDRRFGGLFVLVFIAAMAIPLYIGGHNPQMLAEYPLFKGLDIGHPAMFVAYEGMYFLYYVAWEGTFRGVVLFASLREMSAPAAIIYETAVTTLLHYPKPQPEILAALAGGVVFGVVALRTRSFIWPLLCHFFVGIVTDLVTMHVI